MPAVMLFVPVPVRDEIRAMIITGATDWVAEKVTMVIEPGLFGRHSVTGVAEIRLAVVPPRPVLMARERTTTAGVGPHRWRRRWGDDSESDGIGSGSGSGPDGMSSSLLVEQVHEFHRRCELVASCGEL